MAKFPKEFLLRLTKRQHERMTVDSELSGMSVSQYLRCLIMARVDHTTEIRRQVRWATATIVLTIVGSQTISTWLLSSRFTEPANQTLSNSQDHITYQFAPDDIRAILMQKASWTTAEAAKVEGISTRGILNRIERGEYSAEKVDGKWVIQNPYLGDSPRSP